MIAMVVNFLLLHSRAVISNRIDTSHRYPFKYKLSKITLHFLGVYSNYTLTAQVTDIMEHLYYLIDLFWAELLCKYHKEWKHHEVKAISI